MSDKAIKSTTQEFLDVYDIVDDMVLLKDGTASLILQVGTMNFSLLAEQEQDAVIFTYGSLLNSLNYPIQINIQSQTKDATKYLRLLDEQIAKTNSGQKAKLIRQYRDFVAALIKERNVLQKRFYIVVPASPGEMGLITPSNVLPGKTTFDINTVEKSILVEKAINLLEPRKDHLTAQFNRLGLYVRQLNTQEIIQNFYINYNPEAVEGQEVSSSENYTTPLVRASFGGKFMQLNNQSNNPSTQNLNPATGNPVANDQATTVQGPTPEEILSNKSVETTPPANQGSVINEPQPSPAPEVVSNPETIATPEINSVLETTSVPETNLVSEVPTPTPVSEVPAPTSVLEPVATLETSPLATNPTVTTDFTSEMNPAMAEAAEIVVPTTETIATNPNETIPTGLVDNAQTDINAVNEINKQADLNTIANTADEINKQTDFALPNSPEPTPVPDLNISLDPNLINSNFPSQGVEQQSQQVDQQINQRVNQQAEPLQTTNPNNGDFSEAITPLQDKFETTAKTEQNQIQKPAQDQNQTIKPET